MHVGPGPDGPGPTVLLRWLAVGSDCLEDVEP